MLAASPLVAALLLQAPVGPPAQAPATLRAVRADGPVHVDGLLDDAAWKAAPVASGFRQREPREGESATEATEVRVVYDRDTLYVGVLARDREPDKVIARLLERDKVMTQGLDNAATFTGDDVVAFTLDTFHDHRNASFFATNPNGAEFDALVTDESAHPEPGLAGGVAVAARRLPEGWSAEFAIPFRSLRYPRSRGPQALGLRRRADRAAEERGHALERLERGRRAASTA